MQNDYFPIVVVRKGGGELSVLDNFKFISMDKIIYEFSTFEEQLKLLKNNIVYDLHKLIGGEDDVKLKRLLINFKRDFFNERNTDKYSDTIKNYNAFNQKHKIYSQKLIDYKDELNKYRNHHNDKIISSIEQLKEASKHYFLKNGLLFSSDVLSYEIHKNYFIGADNINNKNKRIFISILKYLSRSVTKTTPFSTFNSLFFLEHNDGRYIPITCPINDTNFRITNLFFHYVKELLLNDLDFKKGLSVYPNSTIYNEKKELNRFIFFINKNNNESFKKLDRSPILNFIREKASIETCSYNFLLNQIDTATVEDKISILIFIDSLIELGFLHIEYPVLLSDENWINQLLNYLTTEKSFNNSKKIRNLILLLKRIQATILEIKDTNRKSEIIKEIYIEISNFFIEVNPTIDFIQKVTPQNLFYEDTFSESKSVIPSESIHRVFKSLKLVFSSLNNVPYKNSLIFFLGSILAEKYNGQLPLLLFYKEIYLKYLNKFTLSKSSLHFFQESFKKIALIVNEGSLSGDSIDLSDFVDSSESEIKITFGAYLQVTNENWDKIVLNSFSNGDGSNISRFLNYIPERYIKKIKNYNRETYDGQILSEITEASIHNANVYPPLVNHTINIVDNNSLKKSYKSIDLKDINVFYDDKKGMILKNHENVEIIPKSFSLEGLERRSKFLQFLDIFNPTDFLGYQLYVQKINQLYENKLNKKDIVYVPRLVFGESIVLQRKKWLVKKEVLINLCKKTKDKLDDYFLKINQWLIQNKIPKEVFITIEKRDFKKPQSDNYKPQYINFESPIFVLLFIDLIKKGNETIEITEMYPNSSHIKQTGGYVKEYVLNIN